MAERKFKQGDRVLYLDVLATVQSVTESFAETPMLDLVSVDDEEMTCTAMEDKCFPYVEEAYDEDANNKALSDARFNSSITMMQVDRLTDKYIPGS